jgi:hypothetical protein
MLSRPNPETAVFENVYFTNLNINTAAGSRTAILSTSSTAAQVKAALLGAVLIMDPFQHDGGAGSDKLPQYTQAQANYLGMRKVVVVEVNEIDPTTKGARVKVASVGTSVPTKVNSGIDLTTGLTELHAVAGQWHVTTVTQRTDSVANAAADITTRLASFVGVSLATVASGANTAVTIRNVHLGGRQPSIVQV